MSDRPVSKNNIIAGLFLILSIMAAVVVSIIISGAQERLTPTSPYIVHFDAADGAFGLKPGAPVMYAGFQVGRVTGVEIARGGSGSSASLDAGRAVPMGIDVAVRVRRDLALHEDAWTFLIVPLLGTLSTINISDTGDGRGLASYQGASPLLEPGEVLRGEVAPPAFLAQAGFGPEQVKQLRMMVADASAVARRIDALAQQLETQIDPSLKLIRGTVEDVKAMTGDFRAKTPAWIADVDTTLTNVTDATQRLEPIAAQAEAGVGDARAVLGSVQVAIDENRPAVDQIVSNIRATTEAINTETLPTANETMAHARDAARELSETTARLGTLVEQEIPGLRRAMANAQLASEQLKLTTLEVRRNPWRLLYKPGAKELESELLYDAARSYAEAVSELRIASESLEATAAGAGGGEDEGSGGGSPAALAVHLEAIDRMATQLSEAFAKYKDAEEKLLDRMIENR